MPKRPASTRSAKRTGSSEFAAPADESNALALVALICSILFFIPPLPLVGLVLAIVVLATRRPGRGLAIAAIIINAVYVLLALLFVGGLLAFLVIASTQTSTGLAEHAVVQRVPDPAVCEQSANPDSCFIDVAVTAGDPRLCRYVSPDSRELCYSRVSAARRLATRTTLS